MAARRLAGGSRSVFQGGARDASMRSDLKVFAKSSEERDGRDGTGSRAYRHLVYGLVVESEFRLNSIDDVPQANAEPSIRISFGSPDIFRERSQGLPVDRADWIQHAVLPEGAIYMKLDGIFETLVSADGRSVVCARLGDTDQK